MESRCGDLPYSMQAAKTTHRALEEAHVKDSPVSAMSFTLAEPSMPPTQRQECVAPRGCTNKAS